MIKSTVIIPTIGRSTLKYAVDSALREGFDVIVVGDGPVDIPDLPKNVSFYQTGKRFGCYGVSSYNLGAYLAKTEFITSLADDDELGKGFGQKLYERLNQEKCVDIWIPTLIFKDGRHICNQPDWGITMGNVAAPTYRVDVFKHVPFAHDLAECEEIIDYQHILNSVLKGYELSWATELSYLVRPRSPGSKGNQSKVIVKIA